MKKGQISLEFMFIFSIILMMLAYSLSNVTFTQESQAVELLRVDASLEARSFANSISNTISQVYAQGSGSKATTYVTLRYLRNSDSLKKAFNMTGTPQIFISYQSNYTYVAIIDSATRELYFADSGTIKKNVFRALSLYAKTLNDPTAYDPSGSVTSGSNTYYGIVLNAAQLPNKVKIVVEWNPDRNEMWTFNITSSELRININPGG